MTPLERSWVRTCRSKQPCIIPEAPLVATGIEEKAAHDTGRLILAKEAGTVAAVDARHIVIKDTKGKDREYKLVNYSRTNGFTAFHQRPVVNLGDKVTKAICLPTHHHQIAARWPWSKHAHCIHELVWKQLRRRYYSFRKTG
jgi:DNA-directed RNA polymerase beta subunit